MVVMVVEQAKPEGCRSKKAKQGECCCQEHCNQTLHHSAQLKLTAYKKQAMEREVQGELDDEEKTDQGTGIFQSINLDVKAAMGTTNLLYNPQHEVGKTTP